MRLATAAMGTRFELVLYGGAATRLRAAGEAAIDEIERWHRRLSRFAPDSLLSHINRTAVDAPVALDAETFALFRDAIEVHRASGGAFDITVAPLMAEWGFPASAVGGTASGMDALVLDDAARTIRFLRPGISLDLGAIAKGHALDCAAALLRAHGVTSALLHGGTSSVVAIGAPEGEEGWRVALAGAPDAPVLTLRDRTLSVSGPAGRTAVPGGAAADTSGGDGGGACGHIMDPRTRAPAREVALAAVIGPSARLGDAWSTALVVLGERPAGLGEEWSVLIRPAPNPGKGR